jgi:hypothetical protein
MVLVVAAIAVDLLVSIVVIGYKTGLAVLCCNRFDL